LRFFEKPCQGLKLLLPELPILLDPRCRIPHRRGNQAAAAHYLLTTDAAMTTPRALMDLQAGGTARYFSDAIPYSLAWSDSCVTSKVSALGCEQPLSRTNLYDCKLDCDICTCASGLDTFTAESGNWLRTEAKKAGQEKLFE